MSILSEMSRLQAARNKLRNKAIALGIGVSTDKLDVIANEFDGINNIGAATAEIQAGESYTIPAGYHNGDGVITAVPGGNDAEFEAWLDYIIGGIE